jgi:hypothetical protein
MRHSLIIRLINNVTICDFFHILLCKVSSLRARIRLGLELTPVQVFLISHNIKFTEVFKIMAPLLYSSRIM